MKTTGISCVTKFRLLVFLGHPTVQCTQAFTLQNRDGSARHKLVRFEGSRYEIYFFSLELLKLESLRFEVLFFLGSTANCDRVSFFFSVTCERPTFEKLNIADYCYSSPI